MTDKDLFGCPIRDYPEDYEYQVDSKSQSDRLIWGLLLGFVGGVLAAVVFIAVP